MGDYGHDEAKRVVKEIRACTLYGDRDWAQRVDHLAAYIARLTSDNTALLGVAKALQEYESVDCADGCDYPDCDISPSVPCAYRVALDAALDSLPNHIKEALK